MYIEDLKESVRVLKELKVEEFSKLSESEKLAFLEKYVQHATMDAKKMLPYLILEGTATNLTRVHCGNGVSAENINIVKTVFVDGKRRPILSDNQLNGMFRIPLREMSREFWSGNTEIENCGIYRHVRGNTVAIECGKCLSCGITGHFDPSTNKNSVHKVRALSGIALDGKIVSEYHNRPDPAKGVGVIKEEIITYLKSVEKARGEEEKEVIEDIINSIQRATIPSFYMREYVAPNAHFPVIVTFRDMAPAELGLAFKAFSLSWYALGIGNGKRGKLQFWDTNPENWSLKVYTSFTREPEEYKWEQLKEIILLAKNAATIASEKKLFRHYTYPDISRLNIAEEIESTKVRKRGKAS
jgi:hypothetical protein